MPVFFVHDPARGYVTPLDRKYKVRDIPPASELEEIGKIHPKVDASEPYQQQQNAAHQYQQIEDQTELDIGSVRQYMSQTILSLKQSETLEHAWRTMMQHGIHHLAIVDEQGLLSGMLTERRILEYQMENEHSAPNSIKLDVFCSPQVISTIPNASIDDVAQGLLELDLSGIPVTENGKVVGMITRSDLLKVFLAKKHVFTKS